MQTTTEALRAFVKGRLELGGYPRPYTLRGIARDCGVDLATLHRFIRGRQITTDNLDKIELWSIAQMREDADA